MSDEKTTLFGMVAGKVRLPHLSVSRGRTLAEAAPDLSPTTRSVVSAGAKGAGRAMLMQVAGIVVATAMSAATKEIARRTGSPGGSAGRRAA